MDTRKWQPVKAFSTDYAIGPDALDILANHVLGSKRIHLITEPAVWNAHGTSLLDCIGTSAAEPLFVAGEGAKDIGTVTSLLDDLAGRRAHRREQLVCFGGGACCDIGGLVAMLYMRGLPYSLVPTSVMAQVDAAVGGKVGVNHAVRKNLLGGFYHPECVAISTAFLKTLPDRDFAAGLAEVVKVGIIRPSTGLLELVECWAAGEIDSIDAIVERSVNAKLDLLDPDPFENELSRELNLGHAVAHALEAMPESDLLHGEAVSIGLAAAARLAAHHGICDVTYSQRITRLLASLKLPIAVATPDPSLAFRLSEIVDHRGGLLRLTVPKGDGGVIVIENIDHRALLPFMLEHESSHW